MGTSAGKHRVALAVVTGPTGRHGYLKGGCIESAEPHAGGTIENLVVVKGTLEITVESEIQRLAPGDAILFQADKPHSYRNPLKEEAVAYLVMTYVEPEH